MKNKILLTIATAFLSLPLLAQQINTNNAVPGSATFSTTPPASFGAGVSEIGKAITSSTNWAILGGYGHSVDSGDKNIVFADLAYNFNDYVGVVIGYDYLWDGQGHELNSLKGGATLQVPLHPFTFIGSTFLTNIVCTTFVGDLIAQPQNGSTVANIVTTGVNFNLYAIKNLELCAGVQYEKRTGDGRFDGNYALLHIALTRNF